MVLNTAVINRQMDVKGKTARQCETERERERDERESESDRERGQDRS